MKEYSFHNEIRNFKRIAGFELILASHKVLIKSQTIDKEEFNKSCEEIFQKCITSLNQSLNDIKAKGGYVGHLIQVLEQMENHFKETKVIITKDDKIDANYKYLLIFRLLNHLNTKNCLESCVFYQKTLGKNFQRQALKH